MNAHASVLRAVAAMMLTVAVFSTQTRAATERSVPDVKTLVSRTADYIADYEQNFAFLLADERGTQRVDNISALSGANRTTRGEFFVTFAPDVQQWISVHDVEEVDGVAVADHEDLASRLRTNPAASVANTLLAHNARYNIGSVVRNFNEPTLALLVFDGHHRSDFDFSRVTGDHDDPASPLVTLVFREHSNGTIIRDARGGDAPSRGEVVIEIDTGRIRKTHLTVHDDPVMADLTTTFAAADDLGLWVPSTFTERYELKRHDQDEVTTCETTFTNYRRFATSGRVVP